MSEQDKEEPLEPGTTIEEKESNDESIPSSNSNELDSLKSLQALSKTMGQSVDYHEVYPGAERTDYDFALERQNPRSTSFLESMVHLVKGSIGAGVMSIHEGYMYGGLWASFGATILIGLFVPYAMYMLVISAQRLYIRLRVPRLSYPQLVEAAVATGPLKFCRKYSKAFRFSIDICLFIQLCGTCCIYQILIAQILKHVTEAVSTSAKNSNFTIRLYILIVLAPLFFLCMIRNLKYLASFSLFADLFVAICIITTMYYSVSRAANIADRPAYKNFHGLINFCGILLYSIDGVGITLPVENNMKKPQNFTIVLQFGWPIVLISVILTGFFGYLGWGESCLSPITTHMPLHNSTIMLQFVMCAVLTVTFAVNFWVPFRKMWYYIGRRHKRKRGIWERFYRGILAMLVTSVSVAYPNFVNIMIFVGNFFFAFITFIIPAFVESLVFWEKPRKGKIRWRLFKNFFIMLFGIVLAASVFYSQYL